MLKNHFKIAWRNLLKNGLFSTLNLLGLSVGVAIFLYLFVYTKEELSFDTYHEKAESVYRVGLTATFSGESNEWAAVPNNIGPDMAAEIPEIKAYARLLYHNFGGTGFVSSGPDQFAERKLYWSDPGLFTLFDIPLVYGTPKTALDGPNKIMLSQSTARKYFGDADPMGKVLNVDHDYTMTVSAVYEDFPQNSTLDPDLIGSFSTVKWANEGQHWSNASYETYLLLTPKASMRAVETKINQVLDKNVEKENQWFRFWLQPLADVHLHSTHISSSSTTRVGDIQQVNILITLALGILLIACINYMNLATAQSQKRRKEVGINKVVGATQGTLVARFYVEAFIMVVAAVGVGFALLFGLLPLFNSIAEKSITFDSLFSVPMLVSIGGAVLVLSLVAGSYPALMLSSFSPLSLFGRGARNSFSATWVRKGLVVAQFTASIILMIATFVFYRQLQFVQQNDLGYNADQVVAVSMQGAENAEQINRLMSSYKALNFVSDVARAQSYPGAGTSGRTLSKDGLTEDGIALQTNHATPEILQTLGIKLLAGKTITGKPAAEDTIVQLVVNKTAVDFLGMTPEQAIGKIAYNVYGRDRAMIVGVMQDFHFDTFRKPIGAYAFVNNSGEARSTLLVRIKGGKLTDNLATLESNFKKSIPDSAFDFKFLDDVVARLYASEQRTARLVLFFSITAILIACLGLFGLAAFTAEQRTKEIGVRKVLGASVTSITALLSADFLKLVLIALVIAAPVAWYFLDGWLQSYAYHIAMPWWIFGVAGLLAMGVAFLTVSYQAIKAAIVNPVKSLRSE